MAKVRGPLMSITALGAFGRNLLFRGGTGGASAYRPADPRSVNQRQPSDQQATIRARFAALASVWRGLVPDRRAFWNSTAAATGRNITGWNLFLALDGGDDASSRPCDDGAYTPPPGNAIEFPGISCVMDHDYVPPAGNTWA